MMETMVEAPRHNNVLPSINHLDTSKMTHDEDPYRPRQSLPSATFRFGASSIPYDQSSRFFGLMSPPNSRRTSQEEHRTQPVAASATVRQSLPSIQEALGRDPALNYPGPPPPPPPMAIPTSSSAYFSQAAMTASANASRRPSPTYHPPPPAFSAGPPSLPRASMNTAQGPPSVFPSHATKAPALQPIHTGHSPSPAQGRPNGQYAPSSASSTYDQSPHSAPANATFGHPGYQSTYRPAASGPAPYNTSPGVLSAPPHYSGWTGEPGSKSPLKGVRAHDSSVKRNLSQFDLEASLYECDTNGTQFVELSKACAKRVRLGKSDDGDYIPTPEEVAQMAARMADMQRAFHRMQEISEMHHAEAQEHQQEMHRQYGSMNSDGSGYMHDPHNGGHSMAQDSKKRRGRAAPPGRCHSCNRAETPEWRRGPDGARTLCNACGLHYAKLTRKMGPQQKANISSSNLRPKGV